MTHSDDRVASEMGRALLAIYRAGLEVKVWPDALRGRASVRLVALASARRRKACGPRSARGHGDSPLAAIYEAVQRLNERAGAVVVQLE